MVLAIYGIRKHNIFHIWNKNTRHYPYIVKENSIPSKYATKTSFFAHGRRQENIVLLVNVTRKHSNYESSNRDFHAISIVLEPNYIF